MATEGRSKPETSEESPARIRPYRRHAAEHPRRDGPGSGENQDPSKRFGFPGTRSRGELNAIQILRRRTSISGSSMFELAISHRTPLGAKSSVMTVEVNRRDASLAV